MNSENFKKIFPHVFVLLAFCFTIGLAIWQVQRMNWKESLIEKLENRLEMEPILLSEFSGLEDDEFRLVWEFGHFDHDREMQILHQSFNGKVGTHIITPFEAASGKTVLVNRGWVPYETEFERPEGEVEIFGIIRRDPRKGHFALTNEPEKNIWYNMNIEQMASELEFYVEAKSEEEPETVIYPLALPKKIQIYNQHFQYVITWFGMSLALVLMYYFRFWHKKDEKKAKKK